MNAIESEFLLRKIMCFGAIYVLWCNAAHCCATPSQQPPRGRCRPSGPVLSSGRRPILLPTRAARFYIRRRRHFGTPSAGARRSREFENVL